MAFETSREHSQRANSNWGKNDPDSSSNYGEGGMGHLRLKKQLAQSKALKKMLNVKHVKIGVPKSESTGKINYNRSDAWKIKHAQKLGLTSKP